MIESRATVRIYKAANGIEAHLLRGLLEQAGVEVHLIGEHQNRVYGASSHLFAIELRVPPRQENEARAIVERFEANAADAAVAPGWNCTACKEPNDASFETCWRCGATRAAAEEQ
ncbi:hypothetical protein BH24PSE2_BH24PSE2_24440 [soil metagenome]